MILWTLHFTGKPYQRQFLKFETKKIFYQCKLCFTKVKHNKASVQSHLASNHDGMKLSAYEECFHPNVSKVATNGTNGSLPVKPTSKIDLVRIYFMPCLSLGPNNFGLEKNYFITEVAIVLHLHSGQNVWHGCTCLWSKMPNCSFDREWKWESCHSHLYFNI